MRVSVSLQPSRPSTGPAATVTRERGLLVAIMCCGVLFAVTHDTFLTTTNLLNVGVQSATITLIALGMTIVLIGGGIDLSVGSTAAVVAVSVVSLSNMEGMNPVTAIFLSLAVSVVIGLINGLLVTVGRLPDFVATLAGLTTLRGVAFILAGGFAVRLHEPALGYVARGRVLGIPLPILLTVVLAGVLAAVMRDTVFGRHLYAVGGQREAARVNGVRVEGVRIASYVLCALMAGIAGVLAAARTSAGAPTVGVGWELQAVAIAILGGTHLFGGSGGIVGTLLAGVLVGMVNNWMSLLGVAWWLQGVVTGAVLIGVVAANQRRASELAAA